MMETVNSIRIKVFLPELQRLGWTFEEGESHDSIKIRVLSIVNLAVAGHAETVDEYLARISKFILGDEDAIHPNLIEHGFGLYLSRSSEESAFDAIIRLYDSSENDSWKSFALRALGGVNSLPLCKRLFEMSLDTKVIRKVDLVGLLKGICGSRASFRDELKPMMNQW
jgi:hypothetical protein